LKPETVITVQTTDVNNSLSSTTNSIINININRTEQLAQTALISPHTQTETQSWTTYRCYISQTL